MRILLGFLVVLALGCSEAVVIPRSGVLSNTGFEVRQGPFKPIEVTLDDRKACLGGQPVGQQPPNRSNKTEEVNTLLAGMGTRFYTAYVIPSADAHQSEYVATADERRAYISGFTGSAGTAVVLSDGQRALWTDGRYFLQADDQLDCSWLLMKDGEVGVPTITEWMIAELASGSVASADARLVGANDWMNFESALAADGISVVVDAITNGNNLVDEGWNADGRPSYSLDPIFNHEFQFAGKEWYDKITEIEAEMAGYGADVLVLSALDETAWSLNLRGSDIAFNPVFRSYLIIDKTPALSSSVSLFVPDIPTKVPGEVLTALGVGNCIPTRPCVSLFEYDTIETALTALAGQSTVSTIMIPAAFSTSPGASYYIYNLVPAQKRLVQPSPPLLMKAMKNDVERAAMKNAYIKDAVALISFLEFIESEITSGAFWTEMSAQDRLAQYRFAQADNMGLSFGTISAFGPNGAIIHYEATNATDTQITDQNLYLLDSGGQYKDGTTDVTRTLHYGTPTPEQIEAYTRVLIGVIDFGTVVFPKGYGKYSTDILARRSLYSVGLDYRHGTSHGIGMFLNVHEASDTGYELGYHASDEPGYYQDGAWGIRIENVIASVNVTTNYTFVEDSFSFETISLVPFEPKLIDITMLNKVQCDYLNSYYNNIRTIVGPELLSQGQNAAYVWMTNKTQPYVCT